MIDQMKQRIKINFVSDLPYAVQVRRSRVKHLGSRFLTPPQPWLTHDRGQKLNVQAGVNNR